MQQLSEILQTIWNFCGFAIVFLLVIFVAFKFASKAARWIRRKRIQMRYAKRLKASAVPKIYNLQEYPFVETLIYPKRRNLRTYEKFLMVKHKILKFYYNPNFPKC